MVGLSLESGRLEAVVVHRATGRVEVRKRCESPLSLDLLGGDPLLVGREIRQQLDVAGIRERVCAVCVPLSWAMVLHVPVPELPEADVAGFLQLEAERGFPYSPDSMVTVTSRFRTPTGESWATLVGVPRDHIARLEAVLAAAQLRPVALSLGLMALEPGSADATEAVLALVPSGRSVQLQVTMGAGLVALRSIEGVYEGEGATAALEVPGLVRELRITLGQLPPGISGALRRVRVYGRTEAADELAEALEPVVGDWGLRVELVGTHAPGSFPVAIPDGLAVSSAFSLAVRRLAEKEADAGFLPPRVSSWRRFTERYSSRKVFWTGAVAGGLAAAVVAAFLIQQAMLWHWEARWKGMSARVTQLDSLQQKIRRYRPWFDDSQHTLGMMRRLTEAFPEDGSVSAKSVEVRAGSTVICSGTARDRGALLRVLDRLGKAREVVDIKLEQMRGKAPLEFTFNFKWAEGANP